MRPAVFVVVVMDGWGSMTEREGGGPFFYVRLDPIFLDSLLLFSIVYIPGSDAAIHRQSTALMMAAAANQQLQMAQDSADSSAATTVHASVVKPSTR